MVTVPGWARNRDINQDQVLTKRVGFNGRVHTLLASTFSTNDHSKSPCFRNRALQCGVLAIRDLCVGRQLACQGLCVDCEELRYLLETHIIWQCLIGVVVVSPLAPLAQIKDHETLQHIKIRELHFHRLNRQPRSTELDTHARVRACIGRPMRTNTTVLASTVLASAGRRAQTLPCTQRSVGR